LAYRDRNGTWNYTFRNNDVLSLYTLFVFTINPVPNPFSNPILDPILNPVSDICFPAGTPVSTDQGDISIDKLNPKMHTIRDKPIIGITQTINQDKYLVCFEKDALGPNTPSQKTIISKKHRILYKNKLIPAKEFVDKFENVTKIQHNNEILYNVLMEEHDGIMVNNLTCETLHPENGMAKLYRILQNKTSQEKEHIIKMHNESGKKIGATTEHRTSMILRIPKGEV
jgi:hypothetical protein